LGLLRVPEAAERGDELGAGLAAHAREARGRAEGDERVDVGGVLRVADAADGDGLREVGAAEILAAGGVEVARLGRAVRLQQVGEELEHLAVELALDRVEARAALVRAGGAVAL